MKLPPKKHKGLTRVKILRLEPVLKVSRSFKNTPNRDKARAPFHGHMLRLASNRLYTFATKGTKCVSCGIRGRYFALERSKDKFKQESYHLNLYALDWGGEEVLMTRDHIVPLSRGGTNCMNNSQTMCKVCNEIKSDMLIEDLTYVRLLQNAFGDKNAAKLVEKLLRYQGST